MRASVLSSYILREFLKVFFICFFGFLFIILIQSQNELMKIDFLSFKFLFFFLDLSLENLNYVIPISFLLTSVYITYSLSKNNEILAFNSNGISIYSAYIKIFIFCFFTIFILIVNEFFILPKNFFSFTNKELPNKIFYVYKGKKQKRTWYLQKLKSKSEYDLVLIEYHNKELKYDLYAKKVRYQKNKWTFKKVTLVSYKNKAVKEVKKFNILKKKFPESMKLLLVNNQFKKDSFISLKNKREKNILLIENIISSFIPLLSLVIGTAFSMFSVRKKFNLLVPFLLIIFFVFINRFLSIMVKKIDFLPIIIMLLPIIVFTIIGGKKLAK